MQLNHLNLPVPDVAQARHFFETYFDFRCEEVKGDHSIAILRGTDDFLLVLMAASLQKEGDTAYPAAFHIGFLLASAEQVRQTHQRLQEGGVPLPQEPRKIRDGLGFYFHLEGGMMIEVACQA